MSNEASNLDSPSVLSVENIMQGVRERASHRDVASLHDEEAARSLSTLRAHADVYHTTAA